MTPTKYYYPCMVIELELLMKLMSLCAYYVFVVNVDCVACVYFDVGCVNIMCICVDICELLHDASQPVVQYKVT